jgi:nucleotide-binding universal stress UspA family protein
MCKTMLLVVDGASSDRAMIEYVKPLAKLLQNRVILLHVENADLRGYRRKMLYPGASDAVEYLKKMQKELQAAGIPVEMVLAYGEPVMEIKNQVQKKACDLVAMNTQERKSVSEMFFGTTFEHVQNAINVPVLLF